MKKACVYEQRFAHSDITDMGSFPVWEMLACAKPDEKHPPFYDSFQVITGRDAVIQKQIRGNVGFAKT